MTEARNRLGCPECGKDDCFWRGVEVPGWQSVDCYLEPNGERDVDWGDARSDGEYGCARCGWRGGIAQLESLGLDGESLPVIHPDQLVIE